MKREKSILCILAIITIIMISLFIIKGHIISLSNEFSSYSTDFYYVALPGNWTAKNVSDYETILYINDKKVGSIGINPDCNYCSTISSVIANWIGMSAYAKGDIIEQDHASHKTAKVYIAFEQSAAQQNKGATPEPDQLHYFITKNKLLIDLSINTDYVDVKNADIIAESLIIK